ERVEEVHIDGGVSRRAGLGLTPAALGPQPEAGGLARDGVLAAAQLACQVGRPFLEVTGPEVADLRRRPPPPEHGSLPGLATFIRHRPPIRPPEDHFLLPRLSRILSPGQVFSPPALSAC